MDISTLNPFFQILFRLPLPFFFSVLPPVFLFCLSCRRKPQFTVRILLTVVFVFAISAALTILFQYMYENLSYFVSLYILHLLLLLSIFLLELFLFSASASSLLMNMLAGYSLNQIFNLVLYIFSYRVPFLKSLSESSILYYAIEAGWFVVAYAASYFLIIRKINIDDDFAKSQPLLYGVVGISLFLVAFNIVRFIYIAPQTIADYMCIVCMLLFYLLILLFQNGLFRMYSAQKENYFNQKIWEEKEASLRLTQEAVNTINIKYHDLKHMTSMLKHGENATAFAKAITDSLTEYDSIVSTGNNALDMILTEKRLQFQQQGIEFSCMADGTALSFMQSIDIIAIFSNALDNAYEAVLSLPKEQREISLTVKSEMGMLSVVVANAYAGDLTVQNGLPVTTKSDKTLHGFGTRSIRQTVEKYHGDMQISTDNQIFKLMLLIPLP